MENTYTLKILNKTQQRQEYTLSAQGLEDIQWYGQKKVTVEAGEVFNLPVSLGVDPYVLPQSIADITFTLTRETEEGVESIHTESRFIGQQGR